MSVSIGIEEGFEFQRVDEIAVLGGLGRSGQGVWGSVRDAQKMPHTCANVMPYGEFT